MIELPRKDNSQRKEDMNHFAVAYYKVALMGFSKYIGM